MFQPALFTRSPLSRFFLFACLIAPALCATVATAGPRPGQPELRTRELQQMLNRVKERLGLDHPVTAVVVPANRFLVSVETPTRPGGSFVVRVEARMLELLTADELEAALAHELGHVWVFTHHPYLQTEQLANEIAMRVVARDALARVYEKVWKSGGAKGNLSAFLGGEAAVAGGGGLRQQQ